MVKFKWMPVLVLACLFFGACNKSVIIKSNDTELVNVEFNVSTLNVATQPITKATSSGAALGEIVSEIQYRIFDYSTQALIKTGSSVYDPDNPDNFGVITESLVPGNYTVVFFALGKGNGECGLYGSNKFNSETYFNHVDKEVFYYSDKITVDMSSKVFNLTLPRKSGLLRINITDDVLSNVSKVVYKFNEVYRWYPMASYVGYHNYSTDRTYTATISDNKVEVFEYYFSFPGTVENLSVDVNISVYDTDNNLMGTIKVAAPMRENKKTIIIGDLFTSLSDKNINITVNDIWDEDINVSL